MALNNNYKNDWLTIYRHDFPQYEIPVQDMATRQCFLRHPHCPIRLKFFDRPSPVKEPFECHLQVEKCHIPADKPSEDVNAFRNQAKEKYPNLKRYFHGDVNGKYRCRELERHLLSGYQYDYCRDEDNVQQGKRPVDLPFIDLPENWNIPSSVQRKSYRDPRKLIDRDVRAPPFRLPSKDGFVLSDEMLKILKVTTGNTEYQGRIGDLGKFIIDKAMYGEITH